MTREFVINEYLTLKLEEGRTNIYVNGKLFTNCKGVLINIPIDEVDKYKGASVDEISDGLEITEGYLFRYDIDLQTEFLVHCSNLQAWHEHDYDTRILHSNLSFPLLKELVNAGDHVAKMMFKEEIAKRYNSGFAPVMEFLSEEHYLDYLNDEQFYDLKFPDYEDLSFKDLYRLMIRHPDLLSTFIKKFNEFFNFERVISNDIYTGDIEDDVYYIFRHMTTDELNEIVNKTKVIEYILNKKYLLFEYSASKEWDEESRSYIMTDKIDHPIYIFAQKSKTALKLKIESFFLEGNISTLKCLILYGVWLELLETDEYLEKTLNLKKNDGLKGIFLKLNWRDIIKNEKYNIFETFQIIENEYFYDFYSYIERHMKHLMPEIQSKIEYSFETNNLNAINFIQENKIKKN